MKSLKEKKNTYTYKEEGFLFILAGGNINRDELEIELVLKEAREDLQGVRRVKTSVHFPGCHDCGKNEV